jgi:hypothetical protein
MLEGHRALARYRDRPPLVLMAGLGPARLHLDAGVPEEAAAVLADVGPPVREGPYAALAPMLAAADAEVRLRLGDPATAVAWAVAERRTLPAVFRLQTHVFASGVDTLLLAPARIHAAHGRATGDEALLRRASEVAEPAAETLVERHPNQLRRVERVLQDQVLREEGDRADPVDDPEPVEHAHDVRPDLQPGPHLAELVGLLHQVHGDATSGQRQRGGHATDPAATTITGLFVLVTSSPLSVGGEFASSSASSANVSRPATTAPATAAATAVW